MKKRYLLIVVFFLFLNYGCKKDPEPPCITCQTTIDSSKINRKVLLIGIDGFRSDALLSTSTPFIYDMIIDSSINKYHNLSHVVEEYTLSGPNWSSILTGVHYNKHNVIDNSFDNPNYIVYPSFFKYIENVLSYINTSSVVNWDPINDYILSSTVDYCSSVDNDSMVFKTAYELLINSNPIRSDIIFLHFDEPDAMGHSYGFSPIVNEYVDKLTEIDFYVKTLFDIINNKRSNEQEDWLILVVSDHGGDGTGHYDSSNPFINQTVFIADHPSLSFKRNYISSQVDLAPTILSFLGIYDDEFFYKTDGNLIYYEDDKLTNYQ